MLRILRIIYTGTKCTTKIHCYIVCQQLLGMVILCIACCFLHFADTIYCTNKNPVVFKRIICLQRIKLAIITTGSSIYPLLRIMTLESFCDLTDPLITNLIYFKILERQFYRIRHGSAQIVYFWKRLRPQ